MKKTLLLIYTFLGFTLLAQSQIVTVKDAETGNPLALVSLTDKTNNQLVTTNPKGQVDVSSFVGSEIIEIQKTGYKIRILNYESLKILNYEINITASHLNLNEVVISGTRWKQNSNDIPFKINSVTPDEVEFQNPQTAADLLSISGKVYVQKSQQGGGSPMIRGFATNRLLYTVDGVRMNTAIFRSGNIQNVINVDPFAVENTEVLFGPGSVIYGSDAIGGVMSFQTLSPQLSLTDKPLISGSATTRYSSANKEKTGHVDVSIGWKKWAMVTSISSWDFDNLKQGSNGPDDYLKSSYVQRQDSVDRVITQDDPLLQIPSAYSQINLMQKIRFKPNENWDLEYGFHYSETSQYGRYDRNTRYKNGTLRYAEWNYGPQTWMMNNFSASHHGNNKMYDEMNIRLAYQTFGESRIDRELNSNERTTNTESVAAYSANIDFTKIIAKKHKLFYGGEFVYDDVTSVGEITDISTDITTDGPARYPNSTWSSIAIYVNDEYKVSDKLTAMAGLRLSNFSLDANFDNNLSYYPFNFNSAQLQSSALTGSLGGVYRPSESWVISANFGTAFRSPNVDDIGKVFDSEPGSVTVPNPDLKAEYAYNFDLGVAKVFHDIVKVDVTGFYTIIENAMVRRDYQLNGLDSILYDGEMSKVQALQNAAITQVYGVQTSVEVKLRGGFSISSNLNFQVGEEELDDGSTSASRHAAPLYGNTKLNYKMKNLQLQFYSEYMAEKSYEDLPEEEKSKTEIYAKDENGNSYSPSWYTLNFKALYEFSDQFLISAGLENILDKRYRPYSSGISAPGRNFIISFKAKF